MNLYLSPHPDDVCFSIGALARRHGGEMVSIFTRSQTGRGPADLPPSGDARIAAVTAMRKQEDKAFARACGLVRHDLDLPERSLVDGRRAVAAEALEDDTAALASVLVPWLAGRLARDHTRPVSALYCPMGIGRHRDHLATVLAVRRYHKALPGGVALYIYEDLPYAHHADLRDSMIARIGRLFAGCTLEPEVVLLTPGEVTAKLAMVALYASQLGPGAERIESFTAAMDGPRVPHETVWRLRGPRG